MDYWESAQLLDLYDETLGRRIVWKWQSVWRDLHRKWGPHVLPESFTHLVDLGCGAGAATEAFLQSFEGRDFSSWSLEFLDRSDLALGHCQKKFGKISNQIFSHQSISTLKIHSHSVVLISHGLNELSPSTLQEWALACEKAGLVVVVEPATVQAFKALGAFWKLMGNTWQVLGPCPQLKPSCPYLNGDSNPMEDQNGWCHFYTKPPAECFQDSQWARLSSLLQIDLRSLAFSSLILQNPAIPVPLSTLNSSLSRLLARPMVRGASVELLKCNGNQIKRETVSYSRFKKSNKDQLKDPFLG